jgi:hypothetical protein
MNIFVARTRLGFEKNVYLAMHIYVTKHRIIKAKLVPFSQSLFRLKWKGVCSVNCEYERDIISDSIELL